MTAARDAMRAAFEAHAREADIDLDVDARQSYQPNYVDPIAQEAWHAWEVASRQRQDVLAAVFEALDDGDGNGPGHGHEVPGVWDEDNGRTFAGQPCEWCATWARFRALAKPD